VSPLPILFIHGFPLDRTMWRHQIAAPALSPWKCIAPDLRGFGALSARAPSNGWSMAGYADDLIQVLDSLKIREAVVCGLSMGGYILFELLRRHSSRVRAAILCNTKAAADSPDAKRDRDAMAALAQRAGATAVAVQLLPKLLARATLAAEPQVAAEVREIIQRAPVPGIVGALHALRDRADSTPLLGSIRVPVLVVAGDDDQIAPAAGMEEMARAIPHARFVCIPKAGHLTPFEQPNATNMVLADFVAGLR